MKSADWLRTGIGVPHDGIYVSAVYEAGCQTSCHHLRTLTPILRAVFGNDLYPGSFNLRADKPVAFPTPAIEVAAGRAWTFSPVVISKDAIGVAARTLDSGDIDFVEVFAPYKIAEKLGVSVGQRLDVQILPGTYLDFPD